MPSPFALVIFDCDGVLVDSEGLQNRVIVEMVGERGLAIGVTEALMLFRGRQMAECLAILSDRLGRELPEDFVPKLRARMAEVFRNELKAVPGIHEALRRIHIPVCVASSGPREKIALSLEVTALLPRFDGRGIFSSHEMGSWKPSPELFLHAAAQFGVEPGACAVVEDSVPGVTAGVAAGMRVFGYAAQANPAELEALGATVFTRMEDLPGLLGQ